MGCKGSEMQRPGTPGPGPPRFRQEEMLLEPPLHVHGSLSTAGQHPGPGPSIPPSPASWCTTACALSFSGHHPSAPHIISMLPLVNDFRSLCLSSLLGKKKRKPKGQWVQEGRHLGTDRPGVRGVTRAGPAAGGRLSCRTWESGRFGRP